LHLPVKAVKEMPRNTRDAAASIEKFGVPAQARCAPVASAGFPSR